MAKLTRHLTYGSPSHEPDQSGKKIGKMAPLILFFLERLHGKRSYAEGELLDFIGSLKRKPFSGGKKKP